MSKIWSTWSTQLTSNTYYQSLHERVMGSWVVAMHPVIHQQSLCPSALREVNCLQIGRPSCLNCFLCISWSEMQTRLQLVHSPGQYLTNCQTRQQHKIAVYSWGLGVVTSSTTTATMLMVFCHDMLALLIAASLPIQAWRQTHVAMAWDTLKLRFLHWSLVA